MLYSILDSCIIWFNHHNSIWQALSFLSHITSLNFISLSINSIWLTQSSKLHAYIQSWLCYLLSMWLWTRYFFHHNLHLKMCFILQISVHKHTQTYNINGDKFLNQYLFLLPWMNSDIFYIIQFLPILIYCILFHFIYF